MIDKLILVFTFVLITSLLNFQNMPFADAIAVSIEDKKPSGSTRMDWEIMFITSWDECTKRNWDALNFYYYVSYQVLTQYNIEHALTGFDCVSSDMMAQKIQDATSSSDLTIIIPDYRLSVKQRHTSDSLGHYSSAYNVKSIVSQAETLAIEDKDTAWTLSHEISHFALHWKGYPEKIWGDEVHTIQALYNNCYKSDITLALCSPIWISVQTPSGKSISVMKPLYTTNYIEPQKPIIPSKPNIEESVSYKLEYLVINQNDDVLYAKDGETFCLNAKIIDSISGKPYSGTVRFYFWVLNSNDQTVREDNYVDVKARLSGTAQYCDYWIDEEPNRIGTTVGVPSGNYFITFNKMVKIFSYNVPKEIKPYTTEITLLNTISEVKEGDTIVFSGTLRYFCNDGSCVWGVPTGEKIVIEDQYEFLTNQGYLPVILGQGTVDKGSFKITWKAIKHTGNFFQGGSYWNPIIRYYGNEKYQPATAYAGSILVHDKNQDSDSDGDGIVDNIDHCPFTPENYNQYQDDDGCLDSKPTTQIPNVTPTTHQTFLTLHVKESEKEGYIAVNPILKDQFGNPITTSAIDVSINDKTYQVYSNEWNTFLVGKGIHSIKGSYEGITLLKGVTYEASNHAITFELKSGSTSLTSPSQNKLDSETKYAVSVNVFDVKLKYEKKIANLKSGIDTSIKSLTGLVYENSEAQKKINHAWDLSKNAQQSLSIAEEKLKKGTFSLDNKLYLSGLEKFQTIDEDANSIEKDLKTISQLIDEAKKIVKPKTCFLFWCW